MSSIKLEWYFCHGNEHEILIAVRGSMDTPQSVYNAYLVEFYKRYVSHIALVNRDDYTNGEWRTFVTLNLSPTKENELLLKEFPGFRYGNPL